MFIESTDFLTIPYKIPNQPETRDFVDFIEAEEANILKEILGLALYNELISAWETSGEPDQVWTDLVEGEEYTQNEILYEYKGLVDLLVPEIYSRWVKVNYRKLTSSGVVTNLGQQNTETNNPDVEFAQAHNVYVKKVGNSCNLKNSFYGFMKANEIDYDDWEFTEQKLTNQFNL
jgi:hypothetical protein